MMVIEAWIIAYFGISFVINVELWGMESKLQRDLAKLVMGCVNTSVNTTHYAHWLLMRGD